MVVKYVSGVKFDNAEEVRDRSKAEKQEIWYTLNTFVKLRTHVLGLLQLVLIQPAL